MIFSKADKSKSHKNTLQSKTNDKIVIKSGGGSIFVGMIFQVHQTKKGRKRRGVVKLCWNESLSKANDKNVI